MLTTAGFRDVLEIARTNRTVLYDITALKPPPRVPRGRTLEIDERMAWDGSVLRQLDLDQARAAVESLPPGVAVAVCFLHSYANPDHERAVAALAREGADGNGPRAGFVTASCEVLPEFREYERFNTTALNVYIGPLIDGYLARLQATVAARGYRGPVFIMTSNGGVATAERARRLPVATVLSGPAAGVAAAANLGRRLDLPNLITCDMGGTSTDVCLIEELVVPLTNEQFVGPYANRTPQTEINAVGAGGGSIAWMDSGAILMVGPRSAGADPGPACYGLGGARADGARLRRMPRKHRRSWRTREGRGKEAAGRGPRRARYPKFLIDGRHFVSSTFIGDPDKTYRIANRLIRLELENAAPRPGPTNDEAFTQWMAPREGEVFEGVRVGRRKELLDMVYSHARRELWGLGERGEVRWTWRLRGGG